MVKYVPMVKRKFKSSKNQMKDLLKAQKERRPTKTQKKRWRLQKQRIEEPRNESTKTKKEIKPKTFNKTNMLTKTQKKNITSKDEEKIKISLYMEMISYLPV